MHQLRVAALVITGTTFSILSGSRNGPLGGTWLIFAISAALSAVLSLKDEGELTWREVALVSSIPSVVAIFNIVRNPLFDDKQSSSWGIGIFLVSFFALRFNARVQSNKISNSTIKPLVALVFLLIFLVVAIFSKVEISKVGNSIAFAVMAYFVVALFGYFLRVQPRS